MRRSTPTAPPDQQAAQELVPHDSYSSATSVEIRSDAKESDPLAINQTISHYRIIKKLGAGGMGEVYLAEDTTLHRKVAIKFLSAESAADERARKRLIREAQAAAVLDHPNICSIYEVSDEADRSFIAMQYVEGETLATRMRNKPLDLSECLEIAAQVADALTEAHSHRVIHRDIKPQNIMLTASHQAKVMDFGLAEVLHDRSLVDSEAVTETLLTEPGAIVGTLPYMSPEQVRGESLDARSDIFSFGAVLYEMITGHPAFAAESAAMIMSAIVSRNPLPLARFSTDVPSELERIVSKALHKDRDKRYQATRDLLIDLRSLKHHLEFEEELERSAPPATGEIKRHRRGLILATATLVLVIATLCYVFFFRTSPTNSDVIDSIAVLPLVNAGNDPETEYLSDGITESLINSLSQVQRLRVVARTTAFRYKEKEIDPQRVGRDLGVQAILTGRLIQRGDALDIQVDLVETSKGLQLWGEHYNRRASDLLAVRQELARDIAGGLRFKLRGEEERQLTNGDTANTEAYEAYLKGKFFLSLLSKNEGESLRKAMEYFQQAINVDSNYALAYVGLANCYEALQEFTPSSEVLPKARAAVQRALEINDSLAEAHSSLGHIELYSWNFSEAEREYKRAIELNPNDAFTHNRYGGYLRIVRGRFDEAMTEVKLARQLDPLSLDIILNLGILHGWRGELDAAIEQYKKLLEMDPNSARAHAQLGTAYRRQGRDEEAIVETEKALELSGRRDWHASLGLCYALAGKKSKAKAMLEEVEKNYAKGLESGQSIAQVYAALGDKERAFAWLEKDFQARNGLLIYLAYNGGRGSLRDLLSSDPRWNDLLRRIGLPQN